MIDMRKLTQEYKLAARTAPEIYEAVNNLVNALASEGVKFRGRKIGVEAFLNALLIDFLDRSPDDQRRLLAACIPRFESLLELDPSTSAVPLVRLDTTEQVKIRDARTKKGKAN